MVSPLEYKHKDPNKKGRGAGYYYKRNSYKRGHWSKYSGDRDAKKKVIRKSKGLSFDYSHAGDRKIRRRSTQKRGKYSKKKIFGWF